MPELELSKTLAKIMPGKLKNNCFTCYATSGSAAIEIAIKYAKYITKRPEIIAYQGAYHGIYNGSLALTTSYHYRTGFGPFMPGVTHLPYAYCYRCFAGLDYPSCGMQCAKYADSVVNGPYSGVYEPAAVVVETFQGEGGYLTPPKEFYPMIREMCDKVGRPHDRRRDPVRLRPQRQDVGHRALRRHSRHRRLGQGRRRRPAAHRRHGRTPSTTTCSTAGRSLPPSWVTRSRAQSASRTSS